MRSQIIVSSAQISLIQTSKLGGAGFPILKFWPDMPVILNNKQLFTEVEVASGGYLPSREAAR